MLRKAFEEIYRVLKPGRYLTVTFHNIKIRIYNSIHSAALLAGFDLEKVIYQPPARPSAKQLLQPYGSAVGDYYIRFKKPKRSRKQLADEQEIDKETYERIVIECVKKIIAERGEPTPPSYIMNAYPSIYEEFIKNGYLFSATRDIQKILEKHSDIFEKRPKTDNKGKNIGHVWWFKNPSSIPHLEIVPLSERVEKVVLDVLYNDYQVKFDDILQKVFIEFPNSLTPETLSVYDTLKNYAEPIGGKWRLKPIMKTLVAKHDELVEKLCEIGEWAGYDVYGDIAKRRNRLRFNVSDDQLGRIERIDVIWYKENEICYEFEVENTTNFTGALFRGANIERPIKRIMVVPEERENVLATMLREHRIQEMVVKDNWMFIWYNDLESFYNIHRKNFNKKNISVDPLELEAFNRPPKYISTKSGRLDAYI
jgi:hypothetical protein